MNIKLSRKQIGQRIAELRKKKGLSQADLAKKLNMSRPSLAQIELGNRNIDILELLKLSQVLEFVLDDFMYYDFSLNKEIIVEEGKEPLEIKERIPVPELKVDKFKNILLYILEN